MEQTIDASKESVSPLSETEVGGDLLYLRALMEIPGLGCASLSRLLAAAGSPEALWNAPDAFLEANLTPDKRRAFLARRDQGLASDWAMSWLEDCARRDASPVACTDSCYPPMLREIAHPPPLLYVRGDVSALSGERLLAVVGTRRISDYGRQVTRKLLDELASARVTVVSGLAAGIDTEAHRTALRLGLPTVAVFGCGLDIIYPVANRSLAEEIAAGGGALISEYPFGTQPNKGTFPRRNRIVAGLTHGTLVVEGDARSGAMITARFALEEGRTVFAVPGSVFSSGSQGPLALLKNGAVPVASGEDILADLHWEEASGSRQTSLPFPSGAPIPSVTNAPVTNKEGGAMIMDGLPVRPAPPVRLHPPSVNCPVATPDPADLALSEPERLLLDRIGREPVSVEALQQGLGWPSSWLSEVLTLLELEGLVMQLPGARVCRGSA
jgi:DNA processing protein